MLRLEAASDGYVKMKIIQAMWSSNDLIEVFIAIRRFSSGFLTPILNSPANISDLEFFLGEDQKVCSGIKGKVDTRGDKEWK